MIDYKFQGRLNYIPGGALNVQMSAWPSGGNWWEPSTGSYTVVAAYQAKGAASLAASYVNLANPGTYDLTEGTAPAFDTADGWTFNGNTNSRYLKTGVVWGAATWSAIVRFSDSHNQWGLAADAGAASNRVGFLLGSASGTNYRWCNAGEVSATWSVTAGVIAFADRKRYTDGSPAAGGDIASGGSTPGVELYIGCLNRGDSPLANTYYTGKIQAIALYSTTLDATQVAEITDNMEAL